MTNDRPPYGVSQTLRPGLRRILASNPSPMTYWGTNTFLVGESNIAIIDPGPMLDEHMATILAAVGKANVSHIFVTHSHLDHSPLAARLSAETSAPVLAFGASDAGRSKTMLNLASREAVGGGEGVDRAFRPTVNLSDGQTITTSEWSIKAHHTPGHMGNHMAFQWGDVAFSGDLVMGWASTMVSPPDGDLNDFYGSCRKLGDIGLGTLLPAHGDPIEDPKSRLNWLIAHREQRTTKIINVLSSGAKSVPALTRDIYHDVSPTLIPAASRNVFAHLIALYDLGRVSASPSLGVGAEFALIRSTR